MELEAAKQKLDSIFVEMEDVVWSVSLPDYKMLFMTPSAVKLYEIPYEEFMADNTFWEKVIYENDKPVIDKIYKQLSEKGHYHEEYRIVTRSGKIKWISNKGKVGIEVPDEGDEAGVLGGGSFYFHKEIVFSLFLH